MLTIRIVSGEAAGHEVLVNRFPFSIGRHIKADLRSRDEGVWDHHATLVLHSDPPGIGARSDSDALLVLNGEPVRTATRLRNGDVLDLGGLKLVCWLSPVRQRSFRVQECAVYGVMFLLFLAQFWLLSLLTG